MFYSRLSTLGVLLTPTQLELLDSYLSSLSQNAKTVITVSKLSSAMRIDYILASDILAKGVDFGFFKRSYAVRCPSCGMLIMKITSPTQIADPAISCYACDDEIEITTEDIEVMYEIVDNVSPFLQGQHEKIQVDTKDPVRVAHVDSLLYVLENGGLDLNKEIYIPTEADYIKMNEIFDSVFRPYSRTTEKGKTLETLMIFLFNLCNPSICANGIRTETNQLDCFCVNKLYASTGIFQMIGSHFIVECKNEKKTPSGGYMSKIHSIITLANAGNQNNVKFGMIVSRVPGPKTFRKLANQYYLSSKVVVISLNATDLTEIVKNKANLLEMIQRKITEIGMNSTSDLVKEGLFKC